MWILNLRNNKLCELYLESLLKKSFFRSFTCLWSFSRCGWCFTSRASLSKNFSSRTCFSSLFFVVPFKVLLEFSHAHLVCCFNCLFTSWGWHWWSSLFTANWFLGRNLSCSYWFLRSFFSAWRFIRCVFKYFIDALSNISTLNRFLSTFLSSWFWSSLLLSLNSTFNSWLSWWFLFKFL